MSVTEVGVANSALVKVGADRISTLTQNTKSAILINTIFDSVRDDVLRAHPWRFATKRAVLTANATVPAFDYDYTFDIPNDCLRVLRADDLSLCWTVEGRTILANEPELNVIYIYRNEDPSLWDSMFAEAMAWRLAMDIAYNLTQSVTLFDRMQAGYKSALAQARSMSGFEGTNSSFEIFDWTRVRR